MKIGGLKEWNGLPLSFVEGQECGCALNNCMVTVIVYLKTINRNVICLLLIGAIDFKSHSYTFTEQCYVSTIHMKVSKKVVT